MVDCVPNPNPIPIDYCTFHQVIQKNPPLSFHRSQKKAKAVNLIHCPSQTRLLMDMVR